jgi:hypothetical protein|tara:strand:- start:3360 stop:3830 length:471 start_codon:yes stop_codon:yes gene_type:complete
MANTKYDSILIKGKVYWASVVEPNTTYEPAWQVDVCIEDDDTREKLESIGLTIKNKGDDRGDFFSAKRKTTKKDGSNRDAPRVIDSKRNPWDRRLIGNGSVAKIKIQPYDWDYAGKSGVSSDFMAMQVIDLVEYGDPSTDFQDEDGFSIDNELVAL